LIGVIAARRPTALSWCRSTGLGISRRGKPFKMYKFRTMFANEQDEDAIKQSQRNDPRITRFGSVLRRYSLDELPQIFNVLRGDMSFVGPRPHAFRTNINGHALPEICDLYLQRYKVRPGITGWAQVNGHRGVLAESDDLLFRLDYDLYYIQNRSLIFDIRIFAITVLTVLRDRNAFWGPVGCVPTREAVVSQGQRKGRVPVKDLLAPRRRFDSF
jgi:polysaccharide biosynthesis protein PslA